MDEQGGPVILALDLGLRTGYALSSGGRGLLRIKASDNGDRFGELWDFLDSRLPLSGVCVELPHHRGGHATRLAVGMLGVVELFCSHANLAFAGYHTATIKKHATGSGRAQKEDMLLAAISRDPSWTETDDNVVDATWLLDLAINDTAFYQDCCERG